MAVECVFRLWYASVLKFCSRLIDPGTHLIVPRKQPSTNGQRSSYIKHPARYPRDNVVQLETLQPES